MWCARRCRSNDSYPNSAWLRYRFRAGRGQVIHRHLLGPGYAHKSPCFIECSCAKRIPREHARFRTSVPHRGSLPRLPYWPSVARWIPLPTLRWNSVLDQEPKPAALRPVPAGYVRDRGDDLLQEPFAVARLVPSRLVGHQPKKRRDGYRAPAGPGSGELSDRLGVSP